MTKNQTRRKTSVGALASEAADAGDEQYVDPDVQAAREGAVVSVTFTIDEE